MLDLTAVNLASVNEKQFYSFLVVFKESIRLKRNTVYTYQIERPVDPTIEEPDPEPLTIDVFFYINEPYIDISIEDLEQAIRSEQLSDYGITGDRLNLVTAPFRVLSETSGSDIDLTTDFNELISEDKYNYLRAVSVENLSYAKDIYYDIGKRYKWPVVDSNKSSAIAGFISEYESTIDDIESESEKEIILNNVKISITRLFDPYIVPDEVD